MIASSALRTAARVGSRRPMSTAAAPKIHKFRDMQGELAKTRPPPGHDHVRREIILVNMFFELLQGSLSLDVDGDLAQALGIWRIYNIYAGA